MSRIACVDCKFYEFIPMSDESAEYYNKINTDTTSWYTKRRMERKQHQCNAYRYETFNNVTGELVVEIGDDCYTQRNEPHIAQCGTKAIKFQSKTKVIPIVNQSAKIEPKKEPPQTVKEYLKALWKEIKEDV
jgi:hypothetical protein